MLISAVFAGKCGGREAREREETPAGNISQDWLTQTRPDQARPEPAPDDNLSSRNKIS